MNISAKKAWLSSHGRMGCAGYNRKIVCYYVFWVNPKETLKVAGIKGQTLDIAYDNLYDAVRDSLYELCI